MPNAMLLLDPSPPGSELHAIVIAPFVASIIFGYLILSRNKITTFEFFLIFSLILSLSLSTGSKVFGFYEILEKISYFRTPFRFVHITCFIYSILFYHVLTYLMNNFKKNEWYKRFLVILILLAFINIGVSTNILYEHGFNTLELKEETEVLNYFKNEGTPDDLVFFVHPRYGIVAPAIYGWYLNPFRDGIFIHGKSTVDCGTSVLEMKDTGNTLNFIYGISKQSVVNMGQLSEVMRIKYIIVDKTSPLSINWVSDYTPFTKILENSKYILLRNNNDVHPKIFTLNITNITNVNTLGRSLKSITSTAFASNRSENHSFVISYHFNESNREYSHACFDISNISFYEHSIIKIVFYSNASADNVAMSVSLLEKDRSRYIMEVVRGIDAGFHEVYVFVPFLISYNYDENYNLDANSINELYITLYEFSEYDKNQIFEIKYHNISILNTIFEPTEYKEITAAEYAVNISYTPSLLIFVNSYHPNWELVSDGSMKINHIKAYNAFNGWFITKNDISTNKCNINEKARIVYRLPKYSMMGLLISVIAFIMFIVYLVYDWIKCNKRIRRDRI